MQIPTQARAVVIGGGVVGCSVAYHLAKLGWHDVVLLERKQFSCGTTWHAAGLMPRLRPTETMTKLAQYGHELYQRLEKETGIDIGYKKRGSIALALTQERLEELRRSVSAAKAFGVPAEERSPTSIASLYPGLRTDDIAGAIWLPEDAQVDPVNVTLALAKAARDGGATLLEGVKVTAIHHNNGCITGVMTNQGPISCECVVNAAGMWARTVGELAGVAVPLHACEHFYIVTEPIDEVGELPMLRVPDEWSYYKEDAGKILLGAFEPDAKPWGMKGIPENFSFESLPEDYAHFEPVLEKALARLPMLEKAGIQLFFNGPESFTPDDRFLLGEAPELKNFYVAAGFNSVGIQSAGGAGMMLAEWMVDGRPQLDATELDIARMMPFQRNCRYLRERVSETLGLLYADHFPYRQFATARGVRRSPLHTQLAVRGACFGELAGWERANWFLSADELRVGKKPAYEYSWQRQNWFARQAAEHHAVRNGVALFDLSSFGKIRVSGVDAEAVLQRIAANDVALPVGRIAYTPFLNVDGGVESDVTVARISYDEFLVVTPAATVRRDMAWIQQQTPPQAQCMVMDTTVMEAVILVTGPAARDFLSLSIAQPLDDTFPFGTTQEVEIGHTVVRAHRVSFAGELGWELYVSVDMAAHVFETLTEKAPTEAMWCGMHALDSCRLEKGFRHFGHDVCGRDHVLEAGLGFAVSVDKASTALGDFIGKDAVIKKRETGLTRRLMQFKLRDSQPLLYHNEPILRDDEVAGYITSGNYGHHLGAAIGLGYVRCGCNETATELLSSAYEIEIAGKRFVAEASLRPLYDPSGLRMRA
ncbi:FAD-dependent oxidoreductase [Candidatus Persebacteraceae bacterium Df01]|uniref:FAD-dependent oxidoreductase n=1 Tax=Candidatus Doriopsillibacter californiensis TaxID=2970740 RepID=A0ABT7QKF9_9GAMM|nr:FAD-dependent oxidoreductase [Candidatus Persebacteraceae bacterium Df01]